LYVHILSCVDGSVVAVLIGAIVSGAIALERAEHASHQRRHHRLPKQRRKRT
jgi:hypothetical protein